MSFFFSFHSPNSVSLLFLSLSHYYHTPILYSPTAVTLLLLSLTYFCLSPTHVTLLLLSLPCSCYSRTPVTLLPRHTPLLLLVSYSRHSSTPFIPLLLSLDISFWQYYFALFSPLHNDVFRSELFIFKVWRKLSPSPSFVPLYPPPPPTAITHDCFSASPPLLTYRKATATTLAFRISHNDSGWIQ
jgi:hypothetical protein